MSKHFPGYIKCDVTISEIDESKGTAMVCVDSFIDNDSNLVQADSCGTIEKLNLHPSCHEEFAEADEGDELELWIDQQWLESENIL